MAQTVSELAKKLNHRHAKGGKFPPLLLMTDTKRLADPREIIPKLPPGSGLILRHFSRKGKIDLINKIKKIAKIHKVKLLVSDDVKLAQMMGLDGVHLSEKLLKKTAQCGCFIKPKPDFIVNSACHSVSALKWAEKANIDAVLISPIFTTKSHPNSKTLGAWGFQNLTRQSKVKTYALGGLNKKTARRLVQTKACGFAGISGLL